MEERIENLSTRNGRNLDLFFGEGERDEMRVLFVKRREKVAREEGKGGVSNFEKKTQHRSLSLFSFQIHFAPLLRTVLCFFFIFSNGKRQKNYLYY